MKVAGREIGGKTPCYVIAEISHNHQGDEEMALEIIRKASECGVSAVKFQKRDNASLFLSDFYSAPYSGKNSFGKTYGEHREFLEPKKDWLVRANKLAHELGLHFIMTVFDLKSLEFCEAHLKIDAYKIQSADLTFHPLIKKVAETGKPYFISCGAASLQEISAAYEFCVRLKTPFCMMYAVSSYPTNAEQVNLARMRQLKEKLATSLMGYSCHYPGNDVAEYARAMGAAAIEKHFTLNKDQKGPDHRLSADVSEMKALIQRLAFIDRIDGDGWQTENIIDPYQTDARFKMGKCAVAKQDIKIGDLLTEDHVEYRSPAAGINPAEIKSFFGKAVVKQISSGEVLQPAHFSM